MLSASTWAICFSFKHSNKKAKKAGGQGDTLGHIPKPMQGKRKMMKEGRRDREKEGDRERDSKK